MGGHGRGRPAECGWCTPRIQQVRSRNGVCGAGVGGEGRPCRGAHHSTLSEQVLSPPPFPNTRGLQLVMWPLSYHSPEFTRAPPCGPSAHPQPQPIISGSFLGVLCELCDSSLMVLPSPPNASMRVCCGSRGHVTPRALLGHSTIPKVHLSEQVPKLIDCELQEGRAASPVPHSTLSSKPGPGDVVAAQ